MDEHFGHPQIIIAYVVPEEWLDAQTIEDLRKTARRWRQLAKRRTNPYKRREMERRSANLKKFANRMMGLRK